jgi:hypothetical protein
MAPVGHAIIKCLGGHEGKLRKDDQEARRTNKGARAPDKAEEAHYYYSKTWCSWCKTDMGQADASCIHESRKV